MPGRHHTLTLLLTVTLLSSFARVYATERRAADDGVTCEVGPFAVYGPGPRNGSVPRVKGCAATFGKTMFLGVSAGDEDTA
jgi:hypothetical protein